MGSQFGVTVDPADGKPYAMTFWWVDPRGHIVYDDEYPKEDWLYTLKAKQPLPKMADYAEMIKEYGKTHDLQFFLMDRHFGNNRNVLTGRTLIDDFRELFGIDFTMSYNCEKEVEIGILKTIEYLRYDKNAPLTAMNVPRTYFKRRCLNTWRSVVKWSRKVDDKRMVPLPDRDSPWKDFCDCVRYTSMKQPEVYVNQPFEHVEVKYVIGR
jgi:hypothetical protein